jgi:hypothetical protein
MTTVTSRHWQNWSGHVTASPKVLTKPEDLQQLVI